MMVTAAPSSIGPSRAESRLGSVKAQTVWLVSTENGMAVGLGFSVGITVAVGSTVGVIVGMTVGVIVDVAVGALVGVNVEVG